MPKISWHLKSLIQFQYWIARYFSHLMDTERVCAPHYLSLIAIMQNNRNNHRAYKLRERCDEAILPSKLFRIAH